MNDTENKLSNSFDNLIKKYENELDDIRSNFEKKGKEIEHDLYNEILEYKKEKEKQDEEIKTSLFQLFITELSSYLKYLKSIVKSAFSRIRHFIFSKNK